MWRSHASLGEAVIIGAANIICRRQTSFKKRTFVGRQKCVCCWLRRWDLKGPLENIVASGAYAWRASGSKFTTSGLSLRAALRYPKKSSRLMLLDFFDRCGNCALPSSAPGSGRVQFPTSYARRSITEAERRKPRLHNQKEKPTRLGWFSFWLRRWDLNLTTSGL